MSKTKNKIEIKNVHDLTHAFFNDQVTSRKLGNWKVEGDCLYGNIGGSWGSSGYTGIIAKKFPDKLKGKRIILLSKKHNVSYAIDKAKSITFEVDKITTTTEWNYDTKKDIVISSLKGNNADDYTPNLGLTISELRNFITNKKKDIYYDLDQIDFTRNAVTKVIDNLNINKTKLYKEVVKLDYKYWSGRRSDGELHDSITDTIKNFMTKDYFDDKERLIIEVKKFFNDNNVTGYTLDKKIKQYQVPGWKEKVVKDREDAAIAMKVKHEAEQKIRNAKLLAKKDEVIANWKTGTNRLSYEYVNILPVMLRLNSWIFYEEGRKVSDVETSLGVRVSITEAKSLYQLFKKVVAKGEYFRPTEGKVMIGNYSLQVIAKTGDKGYLSTGSTAHVTSFGSSILPNTWYLKAGCHLISEVEIDDFINRYNLNWED